MHRQTTQQRLTEHPHPDRLVSAHSRCQVRQLLRPVPSYHLPAGQSGLYGMYTQLKPKKHEGAATAT